MNLAGFFHITQLAIRQMVSQGGGWDSRADVRPSAP